MEAAIFTLRVRTLEGGSELTSRDGQEVQVLGELPEDKYAQAEVGKMYMILFADGLEADAFEDELIWN